MWTALRKGKEKPKSGDVARGQGGEEAENVPIAALSSDELIQRIPGDSLDIVRVVGDGFDAGS